MAYRTFRNEPTYAAPDIDFLPKTLAVLDSINQQRALQQRQQQDFQNNLKIGAEKGYFPQIQDQLGQMARALTDQQTNYNKSGGMGWAPGVRDGMALTQAQSQKANTVMEEMKTKQGSIDDLRTSNKYYDPNYDNKMLQDVYDRNKYGTIDAIEGQIQSVIPGSNVLRSFKHGAYLADWVTQKKTESRKNKTTDRFGNTTSSEVDAIFLDPNGVPRVTEDHIISFMNNPDVTAWYQETLNEQLLDEADKMKAEGVDIFDDMDEAEIITALRTNPALNTVAINKTALEKNLTPEQVIKQELYKPGVRERGLARIDMEREQRINLDNSSDYSNTSPGNEFGVTAKGVTASSSFFNGPSIQFRKDSATNPRLRISTRSGKRMNMATGEIDSNSETRELLLEDAVVVPILDDGSPLYIDARNYEELQSKIEVLPLEQKNRIAGTTLALRGSVFNKSKVIDSTSKKIQEQKAKAITGATEEDRQEAQRMLNELTVLANAIGQSDADINPELMQALLGYDIITNELVVLPNRNRDEFNISSIENATGSNLGDKSNWSPQMREYENFINQIVQQKKQMPGGRGQSSTKPASTSKGTIVKLKDSYTDSDGVSYTLDSLKQKYTTEQLNDLIKYKILN